jgi:peptidylprolyl isomerase
MKAATVVAAVVLALLGGGGCGDDSDESGASEPASAQAAQSPAEAAKRGKPKVEVPNGAPPAKLRVRDLIEGSGRAAKAGDEVTVQYVGVGYDSGKEFDASWDRNEPFSFQLGGGMVIPGWDQGIEGMKVGGQRELVIPPQLAYGAAGAPPAIGPNETLVFVVDLLEAN